MSDSVFKTLIRNKGALRVGLIFLIGLFLLLFSGIFDGESTPKNNDPSLSELCSMVEGVGACEVMISYGESGEVVAVAVICEGADSVSVKSTLVDMIGSLYGIGANRISVVKSK